MKNIQESITGGISFYKFVFLRFNLIQIEIHTFICTPYTTILETFFTIIINISQKGGNKSNIEYLLFNVIFIIQLNIFDKITFNNINIKNDLS